MNNTKTGIASMSAYIAAAFFAIGILISITMQPPHTFAGVPPLSVILSVIAFLIFHLAMLPLISALPAPDWAKASGFVWVAVDNLIEMLSFFGVGGELIIPMRWGIHLATATWLVGASYHQQGFFRGFGMLVAIALTGVTLAGPFLDRALVPQTLGPAGMLFIVWIVLAGKKLARVDFKQSGV